MLICEWNLISAEWYLPRNGATLVPGS